MKANTEPRIKQGKVSSWGVLAGNEVFMCKSSAARYCKLAQKDKGMGSHFSRPKKEGWSERHCVYNRR